MKTTTHQIASVKTQPRWDRFLFDEALAELKGIVKPLIVEIGGIRDPRPIAARADGHSTVHWAKSGYDVICVDSSCEALSVTRKLIGDAPNVSLHQADGIEFLKALDRKISLLYLDGPDPEDGGPEFALECFRAAKLSDEAIILIDDCDVKPGKGDLVIPVALGLGFEILKQDRQVLLIRKTSNMPAENLATRSNETRIGLIGYRNDSGLGELNRQLAAYAGLANWLVVPHRHRPTTPPCPGVSAVGYDGADSTIDRFVKSVDTILFCETPFYPRLLRLAKELGKRIVCIPMLEWTPSARQGWMPLVDSFICPTKQCYDLLSSEGLPCAYFPWPVDLARFSYRQRDRCRKFLFINGWGGWKGRKGASVVCHAKSLWPEMPLTVCSQTEDREWPAGTGLLPSSTDNFSLYEVGDILIAPHTVDGIGLEIMEAMSCGVPVVTPDASPWNEYPAIARIPTIVTRKQVKRMMDWHVCSPESLMVTCKSLLDADISSESCNARRWAESRDWNRHADEFLGLVMGGG